ncbi:FeoB-associated Cys-rich membrane protein [Maridesulfovibrio ferrireducens]|uniref:FeoB-associated Cys-rich membrane protein n=1 Tax=Maridesulfovibrio ferrireducens TaxID=246191 RepID=UPI001A221270|nr:FeoB-associated Cys-rich membrane protein [Maridesulfovibrio ferrireducens]MBI9109818.1 FeoB-associated Cys-rich membrane protein [Maridesulfovibrio ferrireducens]
MQDILVFVVIAVAALYLGIKWFRKGGAGCGCGCDCGGANKTSKGDCSGPDESQIGDLRKKK